MPAITANNAVSTLASGITNVATSLTVSSGQGALFPTTSASNYFYATLQDGSGNLEIVKVTTRSSDTFTIVRAQGGTTARAFSTSDAIECRPVADMWLIDQILPDQASNSGKFLKTDATNASWAAIAQADVTGLTTSSAPTFAGLTLTGDAAIGNNVIGGVKTVGFNSVVAQTGVSGTMTVNFANGQKQKVTLSGNVTTVSLSFPAPGQYSLHLISGAYTVTWPTIGGTYQWLAATAAPTLATGTSGSAIGGVATFYYDGTLTIASYSKSGA